MSTQSTSSESNSVIPLAPRARTAVSDVDQLDKAGQTILGLLHKAAGVAEENSRYALDMAEKLSHQLRAAEDRIAELEAEVELCRDKADRAEQWLHKVYTEIEERFIKRPQEKSRAVFASPGAGRRASFLRHQAVCHGRRSRLNRRCTVDRSTLGRAGRFHTKQKTVLRGIDTVPASAESPLATLFKRSTRSVCERQLAVPLHYDSER